jgi:D-alanyl-lipoteichoic acid acyltransferase DltB (MBOAT superfamily)
MLDGIETVENMTRCVTDQFSPAEFWRTWHRSYNRWIIRYLYVPLGGSKTMMYNVWVIFTFVAVWHDIKLQLLAWGWMIALFIIPEAICTKIFCTDKVPFEVIRNSTKNTEI